MDKKGSTLQQVFESRERLPAFRIKKDVRPYGGRVFRGYREGDYVALYVNTSPGYSMRAAAVGDKRFYRADEVFEVVRKGKRWIKKEDE